MPSCQPLPIHCMCPVPSGPLRLGFCKWPGLGVPVSNTQEPGLGCTTAVLKAAVRPTQGCLCEPLPLPSAACHTPVPSATLHTNWPSLLLCYLWYCPWPDFCLPCKASPALILLHAFLGWQCLSDPWLEHSGLGGPCTALCCPTLFAGPSLPANLGTHRCPTLS